MVALNWYLTYNIKKYICTSWVLYDVLGILIHLEVDNILLHVAYLGNKVGNIIHLVVDD